MKKDPRVNARRLRALERFNLRQPIQGEDPAAYKAYTERKNLELAALKRALGIQ